MEYGFTEYFERKVLLKRSYLTKEMCIQVLESPIKEELQDDGERVRYWGEVSELGERYLRVVTLSDRRTIHNAFPDRNFKP